MYSWVPLYCGTYRTAHNRNISRGIPFYRANLQSIYQKVPCRLKPHNCSLTAYRCICNYSVSVSTVKGMALRGTSVFLVQVMTRKCLAHAIIWANNRPRSMSSYKVSRPHLVEYFHHFHPMLIHVLGPPNILDEKPHINNSSGDDACIFVQCQVKLR